MGKLLGIDYGTVRIGLAVSDELQMLAIPFKSIKNDDNAISFIKQFIVKENIGKIILGLPLNMKGKDTEITKIVRDYADKLKNDIGKPVILEDERLSSIASAKEIKLVKKDKGDIDTNAAKIILQSYLDKKDLKESLK